MPDKTQTTVFLWSADVVQHRGAVDGLQLFFFEGSGTVAGGYVDECALERSSLEWAASQIEADPADLELITFTWSCTTPPPPPA